MFRFEAAIGFCLLALAVALSGCEDSPVWQEISGENPPPTTIPSSRSRPEPVADNPLERRDAPSTSQSVITAFLSLRPGEITDAHLDQLTRLEEGLEQITELDIETSQVTVNGLRQIGNLRWLDSLNLSRRPLTDDVLMQLESLPELRILKLNNCGLTDDQLRHLASLTSLRELSLGNNSISDKGFEHFHGMMDLERLDVTRASIDGSGFKVFEKGRTPSLNSIIAHFTRFGQSGPGVIANWKQLEVLEISRSALDDTGLGKLSRLENLRELDISFNGVTDRGLKRIDRLKQIETLKLIENKGITNATLAALKNWTSLRTLEVDQTSCSLVGVQELKEQLPLVTIQFQGQKY
jgi:Leucine-rich repeat (LRR) protein